MTPELAPPLQAKGRTLSHVGIRVHQSLNELGQVALRFELMTAGDVILPCLFDDAPPHWHLSVLDWLNLTTPNQWICRKEHPDKSCVKWPPRSPDLAPCGFYLWGSIKECVYVAPLPADLLDLRHMIEADVTDHLIGTSSQEAQSPMVGLVYWDEHIETPTASGKIKVEHIAFIFHRIAILDELFRVLSRIDEERRKWAI
ncbi:uncharacterized protein TNCV_1724511 [Trichonephila clavipes]|nr:uncharacterized protein TNCV_1724511 [Trichonephila clavipes]